MDDPEPDNTIEALSTRLHESGIKTLADLKRCIATNADHGIGWVASHAKASKSLLVALLIADLSDDATRSDHRDLLYYWGTLKTFRARQRPKLRKLWPDLVAFTVLPMMLIGLGLRAYSINKAIVPYVRVKAPAGMPVYHRVSDEIEMASRPGAQGALASLEKALNRYTLEPVAAGAPLKEDALLSAELSNKMRDRKILSLPLGAGDQVSGLPIPREAILVLSPKELDAQEKESVSFGVIVLRIDKTGDSSIATVALPGDQFDRAARLLGSHNVFLAQPVQ